MGIQKIPQNFFYFPSAEQILLGAPLWKETSENVKLWPPKEKFLFRFSLEAKNFLNRGPINHILCFAANGNLFCLNFLNTQNSFRKKKFLVPFR